MRHMEVPAAVNVRHADGAVLFELTGDSSGVLIGRRGQMLDALEYLLNRVVGRDEGGAPRIIVDSENYRARRRESLEELARRMGEQAKKKRKPVTLNPMSPRDRRIVHLILQEDSSLVTKSSGKGYFRKLIIIPREWSSADATRLSTNRACGRRHFYGRRLDPTCGSLQAAKSNRLLLAYPVGARPPMYADDTIAAIATPPGHGGIGIVRISGPLAPRIAAALVVCSQEHDGVGVAPAVLRAHR